MTLLSTIFSQAEPIVGLEIGHIPFFLIALPVLGALLLVTLSKISNPAARVTGVVFSLSTLFLGGAAAIWGFCDNSIKFLAVSGGSGALGVEYSLALPGFALLMVLLTGLVAPMCLLASWKVERPRLFNILFLLMQSAALGVFLAQNFFFWFLFWELSLFPAFFLIKLWGGPGAGRAAYQFVIYTIGGSAFMLLAFAAIYAVTGTFDFVTLYKWVNLSEQLAQFGSAVPTLVFLGILLGLAVKVPLFPFHTWLPDAYAEAPTGASMFLTAVMSKMGLYGFLVILLPLFPRELAAASPWLIWLALAGVVFGAYAALRQTDLKRMIAYSSVNHLSYCLLAIFAMAPSSAAGLVKFAQVSAETQTSLGFGITGTWLQMFNHGLSAAALFFCLGVLESRSGVRGLHDFGGVRKAAPVLATLCGFALFSSLGLPGLNGFVGEFLIFRGVFGLAPWAAAVALLGLLGTAIFLLTFWQKVFHGPAGEHTGAVTDLTAREVLALAPATALMVLFGIWPQLLIDILNMLPIYP